MAKDRSEAAPAKALLERPVYALGLLHHALTARLEGELAGIGLSLRTHQVLACLDQRGAESQQQVSDSVDVDRSEMVRIIDRLQEGGLVVRQVDADDRRRHRLRLTPAGRLALRRGEKLIEAATDAALARLSPDERRTLHSLTVRAVEDYAGSG